MEDIAMLEPDIYSTTDFSGLLDAGFEEALRRAAEDNMPVTDPHDPDGISAGLPQTRTELVAEIFEHYRRNRAMIDAAIEGAGRYARTPYGVAQIKALRASFDGARGNPLSERIAAEIWQRPEFAELAATTGNSSLVAVGIGASAGAAIGFGALAGCEILFDWKAPSQFINGRLWYGLSFETAATINLGFELSFWNQTPLDGVVKGFFVDVWLPATLTAPFPFIRYMYIKQREIGAESFSYAASSIQFPFGLIFPTAAPGLHFWARQYAWSKPRRTSLTVTDATTGKAQISVNTPTSLRVTLGNTSGAPIELASGATLTLGMPGYFSAVEVEAMTVSLDNWTFSNDALGFVLKLISAITLEANEYFSFIISNVSCDGANTNGAAQSGTVVLGLDTKVSDTLPIANSAPLGLVWGSDSGTIDWSVSPVASDDLSFGSESLSGTAPGYAQPGINPIVLATATDGAGNTWNFGYNYTYSPSNLPECCAIVWEEGQPISFSTAWLGAYTTDGTSTTYYLGQSGSSSITITLTPNSSASVP